VFEVSDPKEVRGRVEIEGKRKTVFLVQAQKVRQEVAFAKWPQQSDYSTIWSQGRADQLRKGGETTMLQSAAEAYRRIMARIKGIGRLSERIRERRVWTRQCLGNSTLKPHKWIESRFTRHT
jgi:hypothetical protein